MFELTHLGLTTYIQIMYIQNVPVIFIYRSLRVVAYPRDHLPPHVHVIGPGFEVLVRLDTLESKSKTASPKLQKLAVELVTKNLDLCWER
ncbi:MAG: hypothetical protein B7Y39_15620 [Bdellovibrio sp. 28-41-41]|nr:MAG: hypothetical protein B7Y39_15620 [Bdellovibrio sp. 28-41-41]